MKHYYGKFRRLLLWVCAILTVNVAVAQKLTVTGTVTDSNDGSSLPGVNVVVKGTSNGTITDFDGKYTIEAEKGQALVFSFMGYVTQEVVVSAATQNVMLVIDSKSLDEVVVIGYGTVKKGDATGAVTAVSSDDFNKGAITAPQELLMGKAAGVTITAPDGQPGASSQIRIRGGSSLSASNDPLIVVDNVPLSDVDLNMINPNDIETMTVLKDASATAIYGSRASNGVILITTKKGGKGLKVVYDGRYSMGTPIKTLETLNGDQMRAAIEDRVTNHNLTSAALDVIGSENTNWQDEIYQNAFTHDHNISFSGTVAEKLPFRVSYGYTDQSGLLKYTNMKRHSVAFNFNPKLLNDDLTISINGKYSNREQNYSNTDAIGAAVSFDPTQPIMNGNTRYGGYTASTFDDPEEIEDNPTYTGINGRAITIATSNPVALLEQTSDIQTENRFIGNIQFDYKVPFLEGLRANLNLGMDFAKDETKDFIDSQASWILREPTSAMYTGDNTTENTLLDFYLNYTKKLGFLESNVDITAGYSWQHFYFEGNNLNQSYLPETYDDIVSSYKNEYFLVSFFGRLKYSIMDKYLVTATVRQDGSSRFSEDNRWGLFPAVALGWKINEESFMQDVDFINELKLRLGWGITGQQNISENYYPYIPIYESSQAGASYQFGDEFVTTQRPNRYDPNLKWEETATYNLGLDFSVWNNRISGSFELYKRVTEDLINEAPIAAGTNFSNYLFTNVGTLENKGFEASINIRAISTPEMSWEIGLNYARNVNEITKLTLVDDPDYTGFATGDIAGGTDNNVQRNMIGYPANTFYLFKQVYDTNGMPIEGLYVDRTGNGGDVAGNEANKYFMGSPAADYTMGISSKFKYKDFDIGFSGRLSIGNKVYNNNASNMALYQNLYNQAGYASNILTSIYDTNFATAQYWSDFYLEDGSFFRMDNISAGYNFNKLITEKLSGRVSFTVQNAFIITDYSGLDPEIANGIDNTIFPRPRTYVLGLNLQF